MASTLMIDGMLMVLKLNINVLQMVDLRMKSTATVKQTWNLGLTSHPRKLEGPMIQPETPDLQGEAKKGFFASASSHLYREQCLCIKTDQCENSQHIRKTYP